MCDFIADETCQASRPPRCSNELLVKSFSIPLTPSSCNRNISHVLRPLHDRVQANLKSAYYKLDNNKLSVTSNPAVYKKLLFALCFFHASVQVGLCDAEYLTHGTIHYAFYSGRNRPRPWRKFVCASTVSSVWLAVTTCSHVFRFRRAVCLNSTLGRRDENSGR